MVRHMSLPVSRCDCCIYVDFCGACFRTPQNRHELRAPEAEQVAREMAYAGAEATDSEEIAVSRLKNGLTSIGDYILSFDLRVAMG